MPTIPLETLDWLALGIGAHAAVMLLLFLRYLESRERIVLWWTGAYVLFTLHVVAEAAAMRTGLPWLFFARNAAFVAAALVMLSSVAVARWGLTRYDLVAGAAGLAVCALAASALGAAGGVWWSMVWPPSIFAAAAFLASAFFLWQTAPHRAWGTALLFWGLVLTGLHALDYPFLRPAAPLPGGLASGVFTLLFGTGIVLRANQRVRELTVLNAARGTLLARLLAAQEDERRLICRALHEEIGQALAAFVMSLELTGPSFRAAGPEATDQLAYVRGIAEQTLDQIRAIVSDLRPAALDEFGLRAAVLAYAQRVFGTAGISVEVDTDGLGTRLPPKVEAALFRILQESFADIAKYAGATHVRVRIAQTGETVRALVADNGARFEPADGSPGGEGRAIGVFAMRERAAMVGGQVSAHTLPAAGTRIDIALPCSEVPVEPANASLLSPAFP